jgi:DNA mismatch endonuclease (patch repair protein)
VVTRTRPSDANPERTLCCRLHARGLRFARHRRDLPGRPDLVLPKRRTVIFVHGCFWHGHGCALDHSADRFRAGSWAQKIAANQAQAERDQAELRAAGWQVETVWECQVDDGSTVDELAARLRRR